MKRITITLSDSIAQALDDYMGESGAQNRSEAIRDLVCRAMLQRQDGPPAAPCLGVVSYTVDQTTRNLGTRLAQRRLDSHDRHVAAVSVPLDHSTSLEIEVVRGKLGDISTTTEALFLERGVAHGALSLVPVMSGDEAHVHEGDGGDPHQHIHVHPSFSDPHKNEA